MPDTHPPVPPSDLSPRLASRGATTAALVFALAVAGLLLFTAYAKAFYPSPKPVPIEGFRLTIPGPVFDRTIAGFEVAVAVGVLALHRAWAAWAMSAIFFGALGGYSLFKSWHGESCGCFAAMFEAPPYSMFAVDVVIALGSLGIAACLKAPRAILPVALVGALAGGYAGWTFSQATTPPRRAETAAKHGGKLAHARLFDSELMRDIREQDESGPAWLIFCYDPDCHICEAMKPLIEFKMEEYAETDDPVLRIRMFSIPELTKTVGIESFAWETPTLFVVQRGRITKLWSGKVLENYTPERLQEVYDTIASGGYPAADAPPMVAPAR